MARMYQCSIETRNRICRQVQEDFCQTGSVPPIKTVCEQLSMTRGTFYLHFADMEEALREVLRQHIASLYRRIEQQKEQQVVEGLLPKALPLFQWLKQDACFYELLLRQGHPFLIQELAKVMIELFALANETKESCYQRAYQAYGGIGMIYCWLTEEQRCGPYEAARQLEALI